jgi:hypothetical protein
VARSSDDGRTFDQEVSASDSSVGACGCCGVRALADREGTLYVLFRAAADLVHRDTYVLTSSDRARTFSSARADAWDIGACPMSSYALAESTEGAIAAWEHDGQVEWAHINRTTGQVSAPTVPPGPSGARKHPALARNRRGETLLAWTDGTSWNKGGSVAWQVFDPSGRPTADRGLMPGVPTWGLVAAAALQDGRFLIVY